MTINYKLFVLPVLLLVLLTPGFTQKAFAQSTDQGNAYSAPAPSGNTSPGSTSGLPPTTYSPAGANSNSGLPPVTYTPAGSTGSQSSSGLTGIFNYIVSIINGILVPLVFAIAFIVFIFKIYQYFIAGGGSDEKVSEGKKFLLWSLVGFFLMFSIWGLVNVLIASIGFNANARPCIPTFGTTQQGC